MSPPSESVLVQPGPAKKPEYRSKPFNGVVVPMATPVTPAGAVDREGVRRTVEFLVQGGVEGVFVLGTTGEGASVPRTQRLPLVELTVATVKRRALVYAGLSENCWADAVDWGNEYLKAGADAIVSLVPWYYPVDAREIVRYFEKLLDRLQGPLILYNIPATTHLSLPLQALDELVGHPRLAGLKDSENNAERLRELLRKFGGRPDFSVLIGVGALMPEMLLLGADGIVPSAGNIAPELCCALCRNGRSGDALKVEEVQRDLARVTSLYQKGRTLGQSLAALKAAMSILGLCDPAMLPPLLPLTSDEQETVRQEMIQLRLFKNL